MLSPLGSVIPNLGWASCEQLPVASSSDVLHLNQGQNCNGLEALGLPAPCAD